MILKCHFSELSTVLDRRAILVILYYLEAAGRGSPFSVYKATHFEFVPHLGRTCQHLNPLWRACAFDEPAFSRRALKPGGKQQITIEHVLCDITFVLLGLFRDISNTTRTVSSNIQTMRSGLKKSGADEFFNQLWRVWILDEMCFRVFDIASQSIDISWRNSKPKFTEFYGN